MSAPAETARIIVLNATPIFAALRAVNNLLWVRDQHAPPSAESDFNVEIPPAEDAPVEDENTGREIRVTDNSWMTRVYMALASAMPTTTELLITSQLFFSATAAFGNLSMLAEEERDDGHDFTS